MDRPLEDESVSGGVAESALVVVLAWIVAIGVGLKLDIETVEKMLTLAGRSFKDSPEDRALKFCITGLSGHPIEDCNDFLESLGYEPLGTKERN